MRSGFGRVGANPGDPAAIAPVRLKALTPSEPLRIAFAPFELDEANARLSREGRAVVLPPKAFAVLCALARRPGQLVTKNDLLDGVWGHQHVSESVLKTVVSDLRSALGDDARQPRFIETAARRGYRFIAGPDEPARAVDERRGASDPKPVIGRDAELARLLDVWDRVARGSRRVVWISGEAGIGKSSLVEQAIARVGTARVGRGQCIEQFGAGEPYLPVLAALSELCRADAALPRLMRSVAPSWLRQMPWLSSEAERASLQLELVGSHPDRMLREFGELLDRYASEQALLVVVEDLHWSDHATVRLLEHLARARGPARVLWLSSFRPADAIASDHPLTGLRHELSAQGLSDELALDPFSERQVADYLAERFPGARVPDAFARSLHANTEGLPLFVVSVVDDWVAQGLVVDGGACAFPGSVSHVPPSVAGVFDRRFVRLPREAQALLEAAAVCGAEFRCGTVAEVIGRDPAAVAEQCEALARHAQWLLPAGLARLAGGSIDSRYRFAHALHRRALERRIGAHPMAHLHRRVAGSLAASAATGDKVSPAEIALHFELGHEPAAAVRHYADAVESALERLAPIEAAQLIDHARALLPDCPSDDAHRQLELVLCARRGVTCPLLSGFGSPEAQAAFDRARALCDLLPQTPEQAWVMNGLGWVFFSRGQYAASLPWAYRGLAIGTAHDDPAIVATACDLAAYSLVHQGDLLEARSVIEQGIEASCRTGGIYPKSLLRAHDPEVSLRAIAGIPLGRLGLVDDARRHMLAGIERADALGQPLAQLLAYWAAAISEARLGRLGAVEAWARALERLFVDREMLTAEGPSLWFRGLVEALNGQPQTGHALIETGIARHERLGRLAGITQPLTFAAEAMVLAGDRARANAHVDRALAMVERLDERVYVPDLLLQRARASRDAGEPDASRADLIESLGLARRQHALWVELEVLVALTELDAEAPEHRLELRSALSRLKQGQDSRLATRAAELLAHRAS